MTVNVKEENWVGTKEAAEFLGVKPATIRDWIRKGKDIPRMKIGKAWKLSIQNLRNGHVVGELPINNAYKI